MSSPASPAALNRSKAAIERLGASADRLTLVARERGFTLRGLARAAGDRLRRHVHHSVITNGRAGQRPTPMDVAAEIAALLGVDDDGRQVFPATVENWPGGLSPALPRAADAA